MDVAVKVGPSLLRLLQLLRNSQKAQLVIAFSLLVLMSVIEWSEMPASAKVFRVCYVCLGFAVSWPRGRECRIGTGQPPGNSSEQARLGR